MVIITMGCYLLLRKKKKRTTDKVFSVSLFICLFCVERKGLIYCTPSQNNFKMTLAPISEKCWRKTKLRKSKNKYFAIGKIMGFYILKMCSLW